MENDVLGLLDEIEEVVDRGAKIPMTGKVLVDDVLIFELLDRIREALPEEVRTAKWILSEKERIIRDAQTEAQRLVEQGREYVEELAGENQVVKQAQEYADGIVQHAQIYANEVKLGAIQYADELLQQMENAVRQDLAALQRNREELQLRLKYDDQNVT